MFNLLTAEKIKVWKSRKMWVSLGLMVVLPLFILGTNGICIQNTAMN